MIDSDLATPAFRDLLAFWNRVRGAAPMPSRDVLKPEDLGPWLGNVSLFEVLLDPPPLRLRCRVHGGFMVGQLGWNLTGKTLPDDAPHLSPYLAAPELCIAERLPTREVLVSRTSGEVLFERLLLPIAASGDEAGEGPIAHLLSAIHVSSKLDVPPRESRIEYLARHFDQVARRTIEVPSGATG